jgi:hypothetical protein
MKRSGRVTGKVEFREGDGPLMRIRPGAAEVEVNASDVTISWADGDTHGVAAIPMADYHRYLSRRLITVGEV